MFRKKKDEERKADDVPEKRTPEEIFRQRRAEFFNRGSSRDPFEDLFGDFGGIEKMMNDMMKNMFAGTERLESGKPYVYGFSMKTGPDGKPVISEFGNVKSQATTPGKMEVSDAREPLVDVVEKGVEIIVVAELPGVSKEDIDLEASSDQLVIRVDSAEKKYFKEVKLPSEVRDDAVDASYKNGVLEVKLKKLAESKKKTKKIDIK